MGDGATEPFDDRLGILERDLHWSRASLRHALLAGRMGTWSWDPTTDAVRWDDLMLDLFGRGEAPKTFTEWLDSMSDVERERTRALVDEAVASGTGYRVVREVANPDGTARWVETRADVVIEDGAITALNGLTIDITERQAALLKAERLAATAEFLMHAGATLAAILDPEIVLRAAIELAVPTLGDGCEIAILEADGLLRRRVYAGGPEGNERVQRRERKLLHIDDDHPVSAAVRSGLSRRLDFDNPRDRTDFGPADDDTTANSFALRQVLIIPLLVRGRTIGALSLGQRDDREGLDEETARAATELASRVALCYDNALLYSRERNIAETLQHSLVPTALPALDWVDLAGRYWVPDSAAEVGGDFYDAVEGDGCLDLFIGDVCGKGVEAAALTALARHTLRTALAHATDISEVVQWLHEAVERQARESFTTVVVVRMRRDGDRIVGEIANAGHPRPVIVRANHATEVLARASTPVGLPVSRPPQAQPFELAVGDAMILHTDGVTDVPDGDLDAEEFHGWLAGLAGRDADAMATAIGDRLDARRPRSHRTDDVALVVARALPSR